MGVFVKPAAAAGAEDCPEWVTVKRTITETGAYGQTTQREVEEKRCKIETVNAGLDLPSLLAVTSLMTVGASAYVLQRKLG